MPKVGGRRKKTRTHKEVDEEDFELMGKIPKAFIFKRGKVPNTLKSLVDDYREIMYPYTSLHLKESDKTNMKEYMKACQYYQMSHMAIFTATLKSCYLRFLKNPTGPTITFKILGYSNRSEILNIQRKFKSFSRTFNPALLVMNGFNVDDQDIKVSDINNTPTSGHLKLVASMIQSMFPPINVQKTKPENQKRTILFSYDASRDIIYVRHYQIIYNLKGIDKKMKKIIKANKMPNLSNYQNFNDFLTKGHSMFQSDTEASDIEGAELEIDQVVQGDTKKKVKQQMSVRLHEVGPRLQLRLYKIEEAVLNGSVLYNRVVKKSTTQIEKQRRKIRKQYNEKEKRKSDQGYRVEEKQYEKEARRKSTPFNINNDEYQEEMPQYKQIQKRIDRYDPNNNEDNGEFDAGVDFKQDTRKKIKYNN